MRLAIDPTVAIHAIAWEECVCLLCGNDRWTPVCEAADSLGAGLRFLIVKCDRCGLCFTNPRPDRDCIQQFYPADYHAHRAKDKPSLRADPLARLLPLVGQGRLLDFGCGTGDFLRRMQALGWNVTGLDTSEGALARIHDLPVHVGTLPSPLWSDACFEAITMRQSLEHVHQPLEVLGTAYRLLTTGGRLVVTVPNLAGFGSRWFGPNWYGLDVPRHLTHFTPSTLRAMLSLAGFTNIDVRQQQHTSWIRHSAELIGAGFLTTRLGSAIAGAWGRLSGRKEALLAIAIK